MTYCFDEMLPCPRSFLVAPRQASHRMLSSTTVPCHLLKALRGSTELFLILFPVPGRLLRRRSFIRILHCNIRALPQLLLHNRLVPHRPVHCACRTSFTNTRSPIGGGYPPVGVLPCSLRNHSIKLSVSSGIKVQRFSATVPRHSPYNH
jgi:hypothetical protein